MRKLFVLFLIVCCFFTLGCPSTGLIKPSTVPDQAQQDSPRAIAYKSLATMTATYNATMNALGDLYRQGKIDEPTKVKAIEYGRTFKRAHDSAIDVMKSSDKFDLAMATNALAELLKFAGPYLNKEKK